MEIGHWPCGSTALISAELAGLRKAIRYVSSVHMIRHKRAGLFLGHMGEIGKGGEAERALRVQRQEEGGVSFRRWVSGWLEIYLVKWYSAKLDGLVFWFYTPDWLRMGSSSTLSWFPGAVSLILYTHMHAHTIYTDAPWEGRRKGGREALQEETPRVKYFLMR